jgi:esterase
MKLAFTKTGSGSPLVILHGLYGSGVNWFSVATELSMYFSVYLPDQRNHGNSPHSDVQNYDLMTADLEDFFIDHKIEKASMIGHSMGGKAAMNFALKNPSKIEKLIIVDISLRFHSHTRGIAQQILLHEFVIHSLKNLDIKTTRSRREIDNRLSVDIKQPSIRQFLLKNLKRNEDGDFYWRMNLNAFENNLSHIFADIEFQAKSFNGPVLIIRGNKSGYITEEDQKDFKIAFPNMTFVEFDSDHWVHIEQTEKFIKCVKEFLIKDV